MQHHVRQDRRTREDPGLAQVHDSIYEQRVHAPDTTALDLGGTAPEALPTTVQVSRGVQGHALATISVFAAEPSAPPTGPSAPGQMQAHGPSPASPSIPLEAPRTSVQRTAQPAVRPLVIQRRWIFLPDLGRLDATRDSFYWHSTTGEAMPTLMPGAARRYRLTRIDPPVALNGQALMSEQQYLTYRAGGSTSNSSRDARYNPFGRFSTQLTRTAFIPTGTEPTEYGNVGTATLTDIGTLVEEHQQITGYDFTEQYFDGRSFYPAKVTVTGGHSLNLVALNAFGAVYGDGPALTNMSRSNRDLSSGWNVPVLKDFAAEIARHRATGAVTATINKSTIEAYKSSRKNEDQQKTVMGVSADDMAKAAGYDAAVDPEFRADTTASGKKKQGWEWLHMVSYALGGPTETGPQHAANLVVGTAAANTSMIMIEDAINSVIASEGTPVTTAHVVVKPIMAVPEYLIAESITYQVQFVLNNGRRLPEVTLSFDALSTSTPYEATNKYFRKMLWQAISSAAAEQPRETSMMYM